MTRLPLAVLLAALPGSASAAPLAVLAARARPLAPAALARAAALPSVPLSHGLPGLPPYKAAVVEKIRRRVQDVRLLVRGAPATPELLVEGVVTEVKALAPDAELGAALARASEQVRAHARVHGLGPGAAAIELEGRARVPTAAFRSALDAHARAEPATPLATVSAYAGNEVRTFRLGGDGAYHLDRAASGRVPFSAERDAASLAPAPTISVPDALAAAKLPDPEVILRELREPFVPLVAAGVKATITVYGSARILPPDVAEGNLEKLQAELGRRPRGKAARARLADARVALENSKAYEEVRRFGAIVAEHGGGKVAIVSGGGPGIMEAANRGAYEAGGPSVGFGIKLPNEQQMNGYITPGLGYEFEHFPTRKMALHHGSIGLVYATGGWGTMDELYDVLTQMQTGKVARVPVVLLVDKAYWRKIDGFFKLLARKGLISKDDLSLVRYAETAEEAWRELRPRAP